MSYDHINSVTLTNETNKIKKSLDSKVLKVENFSLKE